MTLPIKVLLIDDDVEYSKSLIGDARSYNLQVIHDTNWETGFEKLQEDYGIQFLILDGKCLIEEDQPKPRNNFLNKVLPDLKVYEAKAERPLPFCINTGFLDEFEDNWESSCTIFGKDNNNEPMFDHIAEMVKDTWLYELKFKYPAPFSSFNASIIDPKHLYKLNILLEVLEGKRPFEKNLFETVRELLEEVYKSLDKNYNHFPDRSTFFHKDGRPNLTYCEIYMTGRKVRAHNGSEYKPTIETPEHISRCFTFINSVSSTLSHGYQHDFSENILKSVIYSIFEVFAWLPDYIKKNYK